MRHQPIAPTTLVVLLLLLLAPAAPSLGETHEVQVGNNFFNPANLTIQVGDTVRWTNQSGGVHNVNATSGADFRCAQGCDDQGGSGAPSSAAWVAERTFTSQAEIDYICDVHGGTNGGSTFGMAGHISVQGPAGDPGSISFVSANQSVNEGAGSAVIQVQRSGGASGAASVMYSTADGSANEPADYQSTQGTLSWGDGEMGVRTFGVGIEDDAAIEEQETVNLSLSGPTGATLGTPSNATLRINDNDAPAPSPGTLSFIETSLVGAEGATVSVQVSRSEGTSGPVAVDYDTSDGSAEAGADYEAATGSLQWSDGDGAPKSFDVVVLDDGEEEDAESVNLALSNPTGGASLGASAGTLVIPANDQVIEPCVPDERTACLQGERFRARVTFQDPQAAGPRDGTVVDIGQDQSILFFFFDAGNIEMLLKVLNGCNITQHFWVFFAATTNVQFTLEVVDTEAGVTRTYTNPQGQDANAVTDTTAFDTCP